MVVEKGFKHTNFGEVPIEWEVRKLGKIAVIKDGTHQTPKYFESGIPFYSVENVTSNDFNNTKFISELEHNFLTRHFRIEKGDVLMTRIGSIGDCKYVDWNPNASFYVSLALLKFDNPHIAKYFYHFSQSNIFKKEIELNSLQHAVPKKINLGNISIVRILLPNIEIEQTAISNALSDMDALIAQTENLIEKKKAIKQGVMQELLKPKEGWVTKKLGEVVLRISTGLNPRTNFKLNAGGNNYYVTIKNFKNGNLFLDDKCDRIDDEALKLINNRSDLRVGDILLASIGRVGDLYLIKEQPKNWNINESVFTLRPNVSMIDPEYLCCLFDQDSIKSTLDNGATGSTFQSIKVGDLRKLELCFPAEIREQKEISSILTDMTFMIDQFEIRLKKLKYQKQGMMQALLTGKIRLI